MRKLIILFLTTSCISCNSDNDVFFDCVGNMNLETFYFMGLLNTEATYYLDGDNNSIGFGSSTINFQENTFSLDIFLKCDSTTNPIPICDSVNYENGNIELNILGTWNFNQQSQYVIGFNKNHIIGTCLMNATQTSQSYIGEIITGEILIGCPNEFIKEYQLHVFVSIDSNERVELNFLYETKL